MNNDLDIAFKLYEEKKFDEAFQYYKSLAEEGISSCQSMVCYMYMEGVGTDTDLDMAIHWCNKASENKDPEGLFYLGKVYIKKEQWDIAAKYFKEAADQNYTPAMYCLSRMYFYGNGVELDKEKAMSLMEEASSIGHLIARREYGKILLCGKKGVINIPKGILLLLTLPFVMFIALKKDLYTELARK